MKLVLTFIHSGILEDGAKERRKLTRDVRDAITEVLDPIKLRGLRRVDANWFHSSREKPLEPEVRNVRYSKAKAAVTCQVILPPEVPSDSAGWQAYRLSYIDRSRTLMAELLGAIGQRLKKNGYKGGTDEATAAVSKALAQLRKSMVVKKKATKKKATKKKATKKKATKKKASKRTSRR